MSEPGTGRIAVLTEPGGRFIIEEHPLPEPAPGTVLLKVELAGICGTDAHIYRGHGDPSLFPLVLGHENVGRIVALGEGVERDFMGNPIRVGDRIAVKPGVSCNSCYMCLVLKSPTRCPDKRGAYGFRPPNTSPFNGGFAEYLYLDIPGTFFFRTDASAERAVLLEPLTIAVHSVDRSGIRLGDTVAIQGSGPIGLLTLFCARMAGAVKAIVVGGPAGRLELARKLGADYTIDIEEVTDPAERIKLVRSQTRGGQGADVVFECAGVPAAVPEGIGMMRDSGTFVEAGNFTDAGSTSLNPNRDMVVKNLNLVAPFGSSVEHFARALPILEKAEYPFEEIVSHCLPLERLSEAMEALTTSYQLDGRDAIKIAITPNT